MIHIKAFKHRLRLPDRLEYLLAKLEIVNTPVLIDVFILKSFLK
jgi:hypothetical protein